MNHWIEIIVTGFGLGKSPKAPGTVGTLIGVPIWYALSFQSQLFYMIFTLILTLVAIVLSDMYEKQTKIHDPGHVVIDEVVGFLIAASFLPYTLTTLTCAFVLFRVFDILKPWPISLLNERVKGGFGVVVDDVAAGLVANIILQFAVGSFRGV